MNFILELIQGTNNTRAGSLVQATNNKKQQSKKRETPKKGPIAVEISEL